LVKPLALGDAVRHQPVELGAVCKYAQGSQPSSSIARRTASIASFGTSNAVRHKYPAKTRPNASMLYAGA